MERMDIYEMKPAGMEAYLRNYGWHFSKKMYEFAVSRMKDKNGREIQLIDKNNFDLIMKNNSLDIKYNGYDALYVYCMAKADFWGSSLTTEASVMKFVSDYIEDVDGYEGVAFTRFYADCIANGTVILWEEML